MLTNQETFKLEKIEEILNVMKFVNEISKETDESIQIRSNLKSMDDIKLWVKQFSSLSDTKWNVRSTRPVGERMVCKKHYECHHSSFNKTDKQKKQKTESKNTSCTATIKVKIKKKNYQTCRTDSYLKRDLRAVIIMTKEHSHPIGTLKMLKFLPSDQDQEEKFHAYFNKGMTASQASKYHSNLLINANYSEEELANPRINPKSRTVYTWYKIWQKKIRETQLDHVDGVHNIVIKDWEGRVETKVDVETVNLDFIDEEMIEVHEVVICGKEESMYEILEESELTNA